jgi:hypothetical protein
MMGTFDDYEPEDAWDVDDDPRDMARNLIRRLDALDDSTGQHPIEQVIGEIELRLSAYRRLRDELNAREQLRVDQLVEDLPVLRERARHG